MRKVICDAGNFEVDKANPLSVNVAGATGLKMPFDGAVVCSSMTLTPNIDAAGMSDFLYFAYRHTAVQKSSPQDLKYVLPSLKTIDNDSFQTEKNYICFVEQDSVLIEYAGKSFHFGDEDDDSDGIIENPILGRHEFGSNAINSCYARVLIYEFENNALATQLKQLGPIHIQEGEDLAAELADALNINAINLPGSFQLHAFDLSGRATDCASSLKNIGVEREISRPDLTIDKLIIQFIDLHGNTLGPQDFPLSNITTNVVTDMYITEVNGLPFPHALHVCQSPDESKITFKKKPFNGHPNQAYLHDDIRIAIWPGRDDKFKKIVETDIEFDIHKDISKDYLKHQFVRFCVFHPSQMFQTAVGGEILKDPVVPNLTSIPTYRFGESRLNYFSDRNKVQVFNSPNDFFVDLEKTAGSLTSTDKLYQINWKANAHVYIKGAAAARGLSWEMKNIGIAQNSVQPLEDDITSLGVDMKSFPVYNTAIADEIFFSLSGDDQTGDGSPHAPFATIARLNTMLSDGTIEAKTALYFQRGDDFSGTAIVDTELTGISYNSYGDPTLADPIVDAKTFSNASNYLNIPETRAARVNRNNVYQVVMSTVATPDIPSKKLHTGFVRPLNLPSIPFEKDSSPNPLNTLVKGYYKLPTRAVENHPANINLSLPDGNGALIPFSGDFFTLGLGEGILPKAKLVRSKTYAAIQSALNQNGNDNLHLLVFNAKAGTHHFFALNSGGVDQENQTLEEVGLGEENFPGIAFHEAFHAADIAYAAIVSEAPSLESNFSQLLITAFRTFYYSDEAHSNGHIPLHNGESGSIFRNAIAKGVDVKAIYWEQSLAALTPDDKNYLKGENNNVKMTNIINNPILDDDPSISGKRGYAILDRATRQQGSFHQKTTIIVRTGRSKIAGIGIGDPRVSVIAYIGGVDIAEERWDGRFHHEHDPDRPSKIPWNDAHIKVTGDAAYDILRNFKHRMDGIKKFTLDADPNALALDDCSPRFAGDVLNFINELDIQIPKENDFPAPARAGVETLVQINRTIPPFSCHVDPASGNNEELILGNEGELGILASYHQILNKARKFVLINDQYFMSTELAALLHKRLTDLVNPLDFAIIMLPRELGESEYIDPVLYKARSKVMNILIYGYEGNDDFVDLGLDTGIPNGSELSKPTCGKYNPKPASEDNKGIAHKVVFVSPINKGKEKNHNIYVHSKHMIVDDIWMTIGSANMGARSMTYDWEINANMVDLKLHKGGTMAVRNQRIEILARMVGIPPAYSAVFQDPYASFQLLKAIEKNGDKNIYPTRAAVKKLSINYTPFQPGPFVANLDIDSPSLTWVMCNVLDPEGRNQTGDRIGYFAQMFGIGKHPVDGGLNIILDFEDDSKAALRLLIENNPAVRLSVSTSVTTFEDPNNPITSASIEIERYILELVQEDDPVEEDPLPPVIRIKGNDSNNFFLAVSGANRIDITAQIFDGDNPLGFSGTIDMQPNGRVGIDFENIDIDEEVNEYPPAFAGEVINRTLTIGQLTP